MIDELCGQCGLYQRGCESPNLPASGSDKPLLYVVGAFPSLQDDRSGKQFTDANADELKDALKYVGADLKRVRFRNIAGCYPGKGNRPEPRQFQVCAQRVRNEIQTMRPRAVLVLGNDAVTGLWPGMINPAITRVQGNVVPFPLNKERTEVASAVVTYAPGYIRQGVEKEVEDVWIDDIAQAWDIATTTPAQCVTDIRAREGMYKEPKRVTLRHWSDLKEFFPRLMDQEVVAWDYETTSLKPWTVQHVAAEVPAQIYSVAWAFGDTSYALKLYQLWNEKTLGRIHEAIAKWVVDTAGQVKVAHNLKFELLWTIVQSCKFLFGENYDARTIVMNLAREQQWFDDTMLMCWLYGGRDGAARLKHAGWAYLGFEDWSHEIDVRRIWVNDTRKVLKYNQDDAWSCLLLHQWGADEIMRDPVLEQTYRCVMKPAVFAFADMELGGSLVDEPRRQDYATDLDGKIEGMEQDIRDEAGIPTLNPGSPDQLAAYFVNDCEYRMLKKGKKGWSTDAATMEYLVKRYNDPVAKMVLNYRGWSKLQSTYVRGLDDHIMTDGRLHAGYNLAGPVTGRTSSDNPNMQNFPKRKKEQKYIRRLVVPPPGYKVVSFDYGQLEARLFAVITGDPVFCEELFGDSDIHYSNAVHLFGEAEAADHREVVKTGTFAMFYGGGDKTIAEQAGTSIAAIADLRAYIFGKYVEIKPWQSFILNHYEEKAYIESLFGKRRRAPMKYTEILNQTNQSTGSDMTLTSMNTLWYAHSPAMMIHDDLTFWIKNDENFTDTLLFIAGAMLSIPWKFMAGSQYTKEWVPMQVECAVGDNWCDLEEVFKVTNLDLGMNNLDDCLQVAEEIFDQLEVPEICTTVMQY